jgi:hypothetical protein
MSATQQDLILEVHLRQKGIDIGDAAGPKLEEIRTDLFRKPHPCLRASMLPKKYGWGVHYDREGKIAIYPMDSPEYRRFAEEDAGVKVLYAMRNSRK